MATQDVINRRMKPSSPQPGDGICPTVTQHHDTMAAGYDLWKKSVSEAEESTDGVHTVDGFSELLDQIPELYAPHSEAFFPHDELYPRLKYAVEWITTTNSTCERPSRRTYHYMTLGRPRPLLCECSDASEEDRRLDLGFQADQLKHLPRLVLAWAYVLSARWVEILNAAGEKAFMKQGKEIARENFWEMIVERQWQATVIRGDKLFYAPWCLEKNGVSPKYVLNCASTPVTCLRMSLVWI